MAGSSTSTWRRRSTSRERRATAASTRSPRTAPTRSWASPPSEDGLTLRVHLPPGVRRRGRSPREAAHDRRRRRTRVFDLAIGKHQQRGAWPSSRPTPSGTATRPGRLRPGKVDAARRETVSARDLPRAPLDRRLVRPTPALRRRQADLGVHFGWDYHSDYHLKHSQRGLRLGWSPRGSSRRSPVRRAHGRPRPAHQDGHGERQPVARRGLALLGQARAPRPTPTPTRAARARGRHARGRSREREVIVFSGHSGPVLRLRARQLAAHRRGRPRRLRDRDLDLPADRYQIVIAEGCDTYGLGEAFRLNPAKPGAPTSTSSPPPASPTRPPPDAVKDSLRAVFGTRRRGAAHRPVTCGELLAQPRPQLGLVHDDVRRARHRRQPARATRSPRRSGCASRASPTRAAGGSGTSAPGWPGGKFCTYLCTADDGCPEDYACMEVATGATITSRQCAPKTLRCE